MTGEFNTLRTMTVLRPSRLQAVLGRETLVVCGAARGMTSMVSYALHAMDYPLGDRLRDLNYEDEAFLDLLPETLRRQRDWRPRPGLKDLVAVRNSAHPRWGFKLPHAVFYAPILRRALRNPVFMVCIRNPLGTVASIRRRDPNKDLTFQQMYRRAVAYQAGLDWILRQPDLPAVLVDMDLARAQPGRFLNDLTEMLDLSGDLRAIKKQIRLGGYAKPAPQGD